MRYIHAGFLPATGRVVFWSGRALSLLALLMVLVIPQLASADSDSSLQQRAERLSVQLLTKHGQWNRDASPQLVDEMAVLAAERRTAMRQLISKQPAQALRLAIPAKRRSQLPEEVAGQLESHEVVTGQVKVLVHHYPERVIVEHRLKTSDGELQLHFASRAPQLQSGQALRVRGLRLDGDMAVSGENDVSVLSLDGTDSSVSTVEVLSNTFGEQRVAVLLVNFQDNQEQPWTVQQAQDLMFGEVDNYYRETSSQRTWIGGDVFGWFTMALNQPTDSYTCKTTEVSAAAQQAAANAGVDLSGYERLVYVFPQTSCFASGTGTIGGTPSEAWINGNYFTLKTVGHELGHNLGLRHSGALECGAESEGGDCIVYAYGDVLDIMGNQTTGHFNAHQKEQLGWLDHASGEIREVGEGSYTLAPYELANGSGTQALKVLAHSDAGTGEDTWYYIEYRQPIGLDAFIAEGSYVTSGNITNGIVIRQVTTPNDTNPTSSLLLDMTPDSGFYTDWYDVALEDGMSYTDPVSGLTLSTQSVDGSSAIVSIGNGSNSTGTGTGTSSCVREQPDLQLLSQSQWAAPGETVQYQLEVRNNDSASCSGSSFSLTADSPSGWASNFSQADPYLAPGASAIVNLSVSSSSTATDGYYDIAIAAAHGSANYSANTTATYVVAGGAVNLAPVAVDDSASTEKNVAVNIAVLNNDYDPEGSRLTVVGTTRAKSGTVTLLADGSLRYTPRKNFRGDDSFTYTVSDGELTATATVNVTVAVSSTGVKPNNKKQR